jgi:hypothetical protein
VEDSSDWYRRIACDIAHKVDESREGIEFQERAVVSALQEESTKLLGDTQTIKHPALSNQLGSALINESHIVPENWKELRANVKKSLTKLGQVRSSIQWRLYKIKMLVYASFSNQEWKDMKLYSKILYIPFGALFSSLMRLTIPPYAEENWDRRFASVFPVFALSLVVSQFELYDDYLFLVCAYSIAAFLSLVIYCTTHRQLPPKWILVFSSFTPRSSPSSPLPCPSSGSTSSPT